MRTTNRLLIVAFLLGACGGDSGVGSSGGFGATVGGVKDMRYARDLISKGMIPPSDAILVEAMFSEHDLALDGPLCGRTLCLRAAGGFAPGLDGTGRGFAQVGLSSAVNPDTWERPATTFIFTADTSGSMGWGYADGTTPGELSRGLMHTLTEQLRDDDQVAIVTYGSTVHTNLPLTSGSQKTKIHQVIASLSEDGVTDMESGMRRAYELAATAPASTPNIRVIVFTDTQPNVGATSPSSFNGLVANASNTHVYTTVLGLGVGMGPEVFRAMANLRGANAFSLTTKEDIGAWYLDEWPWFTTPIAFDLRVNATLANGWSIERGFGFPAASDAQQVGLKASTVFLSKHKGALLVSFKSPDGTPDTFDGLFSLAYNEADGTPIADAASFAYDGTPLDARSQWFAQHGVARTTALALLTDGMHKAAVDYSQNPTSAEATMRAAYERFVADAAALGDPDMQQEVDLAGALLSLIEGRAEQGTLYGVSN
ncbi:MAG TPA: VWA domain-containing protein [Kofleriaceae bacterium]|nr:VWA domain-containing protein [Kofleriaceae bacterium]